MVVMVKLDVKDKKLLYEIDFDSRKTYSELAKKLGMSKRGVEYKLKNLEKKKIILSYVPVIDLSKLGYYYFRAVFRFQNLSSKLKQEIEKFIIKMPNAGWAIWAYEAYDLGIGIWARSIEQFKSIINQFYFKFDQYIKEREEFVSTSLVFFKNRYLTGDHSLDTLKIGETNSKIILDDIDLELLKLLVRNPRSSIVDLSYSLKTSPQNISYRFKRLKKQQILLGVRPNLDHVLLGKIYYKLFIDLNNISETKIMELENLISRDSRVIYMIKALGGCDLDIELMADSPRDLFKFVEDLQDKFPNTIRNYKSLIFDKTIKVNFLPEDLVNKST